MADIFISYARADQAFVEKLAGALQAAGYGVWWDREIAAGAEFAQRIETELAAAKAVVVVWSEASVQSNWVKDEAAFARDRGALVPIRIEREPPLGFRQFNSPNFAGWDGDAQSPSFVSLLKAVADAVGRAPIKARPVPQWRRQAKQLLKPQPLAAAAAIAALGVAIAAFAVTTRTLGPRTAPPPKNVVAVLPFVNEGSARFEYLSDGFSTELRRELQQVGGLKVIDDASSRAFRNTALSAPEIAARLGAGRLIEGAVRKEGGQLRINVQIVEGGTGIQTWSQSFDRTALDLVAVQQEVASAVAVTLTGRKNASIEISAPASLDLTAFDRLLLARSYEQRVRDAQVVDQAALGKAIDLYRLAVKADPRSALAHSRLAGALLYAGDAVSADSEIKAAVDLDPDLSEVQSTLGLYNYARGIAGVAAAYARAVDLNPNDADALTHYADANWAHLFGAIQKSEAFYLRAVELDPMSLRRYTTLGYFYGVTGQRDKALALVQRIAARFSDARALSTVGEILELTGDFDLAIAAAKKALRLAPQDRDIKAQLAEFYAEIGDFKTAAMYEPQPGIGQLFWRRDYPRLIDLAEEQAIDQPQDTQIWHLLGFAYSVEGDYANAVRVLSLAGLPEKAESESHIANDSEGMATLAGALSALGRGQEARAVAGSTVVLMKKFLETGADRGTWANTLLSCSLAVLGRDDEAMAALSKVNDGPGLPRLPWLKDHICFKRFTADPRYRSVIAAVERRQSEMRGRAAALDKDEPN